jgi:hypothetical protein
MKVKIDTDEWYPVYSIDDAGYTEVEITKEQFYKWENAYVAFKEAQKEMGDAIAIAKEA